MQLVHKMQEINKYDRTMEIFCNQNILFSSIYKALVWNLVLQNILNENDTFHSRFLKTQTDKYMCEEEGFSFAQGSPINRKAKTKYKWAMLLGTYLWD